MVAAGGDICPGLGDHLFALEKRVERRVLKGEREI